MPIYNDADDSDAWRDDESMTSTDGFSSHAGDLESIEDSDDYEFLSRSSSRAQTEEEREETDSDDHVSESYATASVVTGVGNDDTSVIVTVEDSMEDIANSVLQSTELPRVLPDTQTMDDSTSTVTQNPRQRRDTVTQNPTHVTPTGKPFNILYAGSEAMKHNVIRKLGQSLMAATLQDRNLDESASDWSNGYTNVVPVTDFNSDAAPEVEFVEDSLVKMRLVDIEGLQVFTSRRANHFSCQLQNKVISCHHGRRNTTCAWFDKAETFPSLLVYCSSTRGEKSNVSLQKIELFAEVHHIPLLVISDWEKSSKRYSFSWNDTNIPIPESEGRPVVLGYQSLTSKKFFELDLPSLGLSLWKNEAISQDAVKAATQKVFSLFNNTNISLGGSLISRNILNITLLPDFLSSFSYFSPRWLIIPAPW
jgi:hypothetical protein